jgi:polysaccharide export outer membrane protein
MKLAIYIVLLVVLSSCKAVNLFQTNKNTDNSLTTFTLLNKNYEHILIPDNKISLSIWNHDDLSIGSVYSIYNTNESFGKWILINNDSTASIPFIGSINLVGLTVAQAEVIITDSLKRYIKDPIIEVKVLNKEITILGEVKSPGNYLLEKESNTLIEYLGKSEGLNFYADTKHIQIIRDDIPYIIDLTQLESFNRKNIYLKANDIIYIPSKKGKNLALKSPILIPFASLLTSIGILISVVSK